MERILHVLSLVTAIVLIGVLYKTLEKHGEIAHFTHPFEKRVFSQNGEDGVIEKIFELIGTTNKFYVEFGVESGEECNTRALRELHGFNGLLMDGNNQNGLINLHKHFITTDNIVALFKQYRVPLAFDLLSVDVDGNDVYICDVVLKHGFRPRVIVIEFNSMIPPTPNAAISYDPAFIWNGTDYFGASLEAIRILGAAYGYSLIYVEDRGVNAFLIQDVDVHKVKHVFTDVNDVYKLYRALQPPHRHDYAEMREYTTFVPGAIG